MSVEQLNLESNSHENLKEALLKWNIDVALGNQESITQKTPRMVEDMIIDSYEFLEKTWDPDSFFPNSPEYTESMVKILDDFLLKSA